MSTFVKKATSAVAGLAIVFSMVTPIAGVSAALSGVEAANQLATLGIIVDQSANPADYRLGDNLPRREAVKVMMNLSSIAVIDNCSGQFSDLTSADWACKYAETALTNSLVAGNSRFRPSDLVSKIEALKMVFQGRDLERDNNADWRAGYVDAAVSMGIATSFSDYNTPATRAEMFIWAAEAINMDGEVVTEDPLCDLLGICEEDPVDPVDPVDPTDPIIVDGSELLVSLSPMSPAATTIPGGVNGLKAAAFDFTAGDSDVTVSQVSVKRTGLSDADTLSALAVFTAAGRVSNARNDNQDNDTTAQINIDNGGIVIQAGETVTLMVVVDVPTIASNPSIESDEFALELVDVTANSTVTGLGTRGSTMRIGSVDAPSITFADNGSVSNPNLGEVAADIFEFEIQGDNDEDVMVESITFEGSSDAEDDLRNFELLMGNTVVATTAMMSGDYLTFDLDGLLIQEDKNVDFTVRADVIEGAGDIISFGIDAKLDVTANSTKFGFGAGVVIAGFNPPSITIQAGELTFIEVESDIDEIREDKDNVVLATFKIINLSGNGLELADFAAQIAMTDAATTTVGSISPVAAVPSSIFTEVELYNMETGSSYTLDASSLTAATVKFADTNIDALIGEGTTTWMIRADTAEDINGFDNISFDVSINLATEDSSGNAINDIVINETTDDERVIDITPSSLSFNSIDGSESGASINVLSLSPSIDVVRGANNVVAFEFEVEAEQVSSLTVDELTVALFSDQGPSISSVDGTTPVTTQTIAVTVNTAPTLGDMYSITVNGTTYTYTAVSGATTTTVATALASQIAGATSAAAVMTIPATTITYPAGQYTQATPLASNVFTASVELGNVNGTFSYQVNVNGTTTIAATTAAALAANITANVTNVTATANGDKITLTSTGAITITAPVTTGTATNVAATKQQISLVNLYKDSVSAANLLDGDSLSNLGTVTFSNMGDVMIPANGKQKFVVTVSLVDGNDAVTGSAYRASLTAISITDDENDDIVVTLPVASNRSIAVTNSGTIATLFLDPANADNEFDKLGLAGDASIIASWDVRANDETIDVEVVTFTLGGVSTAVVDSLKSSVATADILLNGVVVGTASNSDISSTNMGVGTIIFDDLTALILPETTGELALRLNTANIGRNLVGQTQTGLTVTNIALSKAEGNESGKVVADLSVAAPSQTLDIVSAVVTPSITAVLSNTNTTAKLRLVVAGGNNTTANGDAVQAELTSLKIAYTGNMAGQTATVKNSTGLTVGTANFDAATDTANEIVVSVTSDSIGNSNEVYEIIIDRVATSSNTFDIAQDGVTYTINGANTTTVKLNNTLDLGEYTVTN